MKKYSSIEQFRNVVKQVRFNHDFKGKDENGDSIYTHTENYPTLKFIGTVKLHGTNAGIVKYKDGKIEYQSRERVLAIGDDNSGFMNYMSQKNLEPLFERFTFEESIAIFGEWCGGNIQKSVALNQLEKMFVIFGIKVDDKWIELPTDLYQIENRIYNILQFETFEVEIDFNQPELIQNKLIELTIAIEETCPVGKFFKVQGVGEGIVFTCSTNQDLKFKSKGEKHSVSKVKTLNSIDLELVANINQFVDKVVTENRLEQGISYFKENNLEIDYPNVGKFLQWIVNDVLKEESELLKESNLNDSLVRKAVVNKARIWFLNIVNKII